MTDGDRFRIDFTGQVLLGVYRVERKLAEGGMGAIYAARDENLDRPVVVKVPHPRFLGEPAFVARFSREVEELIRLEHPHIARILARGEHEGVPFFVLQYLGGGSLEDRIARGDRRLDWLETVAATLDHIHDQGIVHRDIKPANILFDAAGHVFLSDFGVAKVVSEESGITGTGVGIGSPRYMAPEQGTGKSVGAPADQYALAATVYELLAGRAPFEGDNPLEILVEKSRVEPPSLTPIVSADAARAVARALAKDPGRRFGSCAEFVAAFRAGLEPRPSRRRRVVGTVVAALVTAVLAILALLADRKPSIVLLDPGTGPRATLRYVPTPGLVQRATLTMSMMSRSSAGRREPPSESMDWEVRADPEGGEFLFEWLVTSGRLKGVEGYGSLTEDGLLGPMDVTPVGQPGVERIAAVFRQQPIPLPAEPVGLGAIWETRETVTLLGSSVTQIIRYRLLARDGDRLTVSVSAAEAAPPAAILDSEAGLQVSGLSASVSGEAVVDLRRPLPVTSTSRLVMSLTGTKDGQPIDVEVELTTKLETR